MAGEAVARRRKLSTKSFVLWCLGLVALSAYLFVTAPPPLDAPAPAKGTIPIERALATLNDVNARVRALYTSEIVRAGQQAGIPFDEEWKRREVVAGPLPALFLRETAAHLEASKAPLGLFLGSAEPINAANQFSDEQLTHFRRLEDGGPTVSFYSADTKRHISMFPDVAADPLCVECHNEHPQSQRRDWRLDDIMGATTWSYPAERVSLEELAMMTDVLLDGIEASYGGFLAEMRQMKPMPAIGRRWPRSGYFVPTKETFMKEVRARVAPVVLDAVVARAQADASR